MRFAEVAVDAPTGHDRTFSYSIPRSLTVLPGQLVLIPFGPRTLQGIVFSLAPAPQVPETRDISRVTTGEPALTPAQLDLARWIGNHYICPLFEAAALMLSPGERLRPRTDLSLGDVPVGTGARPLTSSQRKVVEYIRARARVDQERLIRAMGEWARVPLARLVDRGIVVRTDRRSRPSVGPKRRDYARLSSEGGRATPEALLEPSRRAPRQAELLARLQAGGAPVTLAGARREYGASAVSGLLARGWIEKHTASIERDPLAGRVFSLTSTVTLNPRQDAAAAEIRAALDDPTALPRAFLVQGVTGSGKTEVYQDAVAHCLTLGKKAIVLVPEIALTHQTVERFAARFPGRIAVLHSGLSAGERFDQWRGIQRGEYDVVIGSRSALFAPQPRLGLIVLDEEHEWTYKQHDASPRYHAREVALRLAELTGAAVVLGSASPDLVSYHRALKGDYRLLTLPDRVASTGDGTSSSGSAPLASVEIVDLRRELREGNRSIFSRALDKAMEECLDAGDQMILFLNRRGSAGYTQCRSCGLSLRCRRCDIALTYHKAADRLICHYCGYRRIAPAKCPKCLSYRMSYYGVGTQTVAEEFSLRFPGATIIRLDSDAARGSRAHESLLSRFRSGEAQALVGTQMVAKGHHFPAVSLVGVVCADVGINIPDYRAGERVFQLLCQVAGRAGRGSSAGRVIVQTYQPDNYAVQAAAAQDYQAFYREEMAYRREQANPPLTRLVRLLYAHTNQARCEREASRLARLIEAKRETWGHSDIELLGPTPAYPPRLRGHYRRHLILRGLDPRKLLDRVAIPSTWTVDIDPVSLT